MPLPRAAPPTGCDAMRMTLYYLTRTVKNQIRKLFRTWVAVFLLVCFGIGILFGLGAAGLSALFEEDAPAEEFTEEMPDGEAAEEH